MTSRSGQPKPDDVRCPSCSAIEWRRVGERVFLDGGRGRERLRHALTNEGGAFEWACDACGYEVKAGSSLDHRISRVQGRRGKWREALGLVGLPLGGAATQSPPRGGGHTQSAPSTPAGGVVAIGAVAAVAATALVVASILGVGTRTPAGEGSTACERLGSEVAQIKAAATASRPNPRCVELTAVPVQSVTGDVTFWLGRSPSDRLFVVLNEAVQGERAVQVRAGQLLDITGSVERTPVRGVELTPEDRAALQDETVYVHAQWVKVEAP